MKNLTPEPEEETQPVETDAEQAGKGGCLRPWLIILLGILMLLLIAALSAYGGFQSGLEQRVEAKDTQLAQGVQTQSALGLQEIDKGMVDLSRQRLDWLKTQPASARILNQEIAAELQLQFDLAQQDVSAKRYPQAQMRLEWILEWMPDYPGALDLLSEMLYQSQITPTTIPSPTVTLTPTPDNRGKEKLFNDAQQALNAANWSAAIDDLLTLRKQDAAYQAIKVDGMLYMAYRGRGVDKIQGKNQTDSTIQGVDLQGGTYDLALAEQFGPLDLEAQAWQRRVSWYLTGVGYWGVNWEKALGYFEMLYLEAPYLGDGTMYAIDRYRQGLMKYGDWLALQGLWCDAQAQYQKSFDSGNTDAAQQPTAVYASDQCSGSGNSGGGQESTPTPEGGVNTPEPGSEASPTLESPTETPTLEMPSETPTP